MSDGGPAFPRPFSDNGGDTFERYEMAQDGMSLRDFFAAAALTGLTSDPNVSAGKTKLVAEIAYRFADAMLVEREK
jgi:hypothetical protein